MSSHYKNLLLFVFVLFKSPKNMLIYTNGVNPPWLEEEATAVSAFRTCFASNITAHVWHDGDLLDECEAERRGSQTSYAIKLLPF